MNPGPPGPPGPTHPPGHPPPGPPRPRARRRLAYALLTAAAALAVLAVAWVLTPATEPVWTSQLMPAADRDQHGDLLTVALAGALAVAYLVTSTLLATITHRTRQ